MWCVLVGSVSLEVLPPVVALRFMGFVDCEAFGS
jgi:hypothetical protein